MFEDFINWTPEKCKKLILEYQQTKNKDLFSLLLARYDRYLVNLVWKFRKNYSFLANESGAELYQIAVVAFAKFLEKFKKKASSQLIIPVIKAYVKAAFFSAYNYKRYEYNSEVNPSVFGFFQDENDKDKEEVENLENRLAVHFLLKSQVLTKKEKALLKMRFIKGLTLRQIARKRHKSKVFVHKRIKKCLTKLKKEVKK